MISILSEDEKSKNYKQVAKKEQLLSPTALLLPFVPF